jgi:ferredoxin
MSTIIAGQALRELVADWISRGRRVAGPGLVKDDLVLYRWLHRSDQLLLESYARPHNSIKEFLFPRHERLYGYRIDGRKIELVDQPLPEQERILIAARPCDAASLPILDHVFNWDYHDVFYNRRRNLTTIITLACREHDAHCFCTGVGGGPADERGSDVMLLPLGQDRYEVRCLTDRGRRLFEGRLESSTLIGRVGRGPDRRIDMDSVREFLQSEFDSPQWAAMTMRCIGCGACACNCPTCHCFDIADEKSGALAGARVRNWDSCQFANFTAHASGHNPRTVQSQRQRQRVYHKFEVYPAKFGETLCTGCGNCSRVCPVGLGVLPVLAALGGDRVVEPSDETLV